MSGEDKKKLPQYKGKLNAANIAAGMNAAIKNARRLFNSAEILFENKDYATAVSLAILAIEEAGKTSILREISLVTDETLLKKCWKEYRRHTQKTKAWNMVDYIKRGSVKLQDFKGMFNPDNTSSNQLDQVKQIGFYTDCLGSAHWSIPEEIIDKDFAEQILLIARMHCQSDYEISTREIELWIECLTPVWMTSMNKMKQGLLNWHQRMQEEGLADASDRFADFVNTGINLEFKK